jgi:hypothetical protein
VTLLVSAGEPQVIFSNEKDIVRINGSTGAKLDAVAASPADETDPTWAADGIHVAYVADGKILLKDTSKKNSAATPISGGSDIYSNLAWAPTADVNLLAMAKQISDTDNDLCLATITKAPFAPKCFTEPGFSVIRAIHWAPDGKSILGVGAKGGTGAPTAFGIVRWKVKAGKPAFSPDPADWSQGHFVSNIGDASKGALDAAISPDGKKLAIISNEGASFFRLWIVPAGDFHLTSGQPTPIRACKVTWRGDGQELMVIQSDALCGEEVGELVRVNAANPRVSKVLSPVANDPQYQPFNLGN